MSPLARHATRQRAANDIVVQVVARIVNLAIGVVVTALVVRTLGNSGYGQWSTLLIVIGLVSYFGAFGMEGVALREAAREPEREHEWIGAVTMLRLLLVVPVMLTSLIAVVLLQESHQMLIAGLILVVTMPFGGAGALILLFQLRVDNRVPMFLLTLRSLLWGAAVAIIYLNDGDMVDLAIAMAVTNALVALAEFAAILRSGIRWPRPSRKHLRPLFRSGLPVGISGLLITAYASIDQVIVFVIAGSKSAGLYGAVYNVLNQAHFIPASVLTTLAPVLAASWPLDRGRMLRTARLTAELLSVASFGALAFVTVAATPIVRLFFGAEFIEAAPALPVLGAAFIFISFGYLNGNLMVTMGLEKRLLRISLLALVVNLVGNLILVPLTGFMGAAWMTLVTEIVVFAAALRIVLRTLELPRPKLGRIGRTASAAVLLGGALAVTKLLGGELIALTVAACLLYPALLFGLRALDMDDVRVLLRRGRFV
jgi:O-antigen/teichoic acid export membrane protein